MDALNPQHVLQARFVLTYQQRNITRDVSEHLLSLTYTDHLTGNADSLEVELEDTQGRWRDAWYPGHGDTLTLAIGWQGAPLRTLGRLEIDEVELNGPPSTITIHALATGINGPLRTVEHRAYEDLTLAAIAQQIATRQGLTLVGHIEPIPLDRLTQQDTDLTFLRNLAATYDYAFKITGRQLVFHAIQRLAQAAPVATHRLTDLANINLRDQIKTVPKAIEIKHKDPAKKQLITYTLVNNQTVAAPSSASQTTTSADTHKSRQRSTSTEQAQAKAKAELAQANRQRTTGQWTTQGQPHLTSGTSFDSSPPANSTAATSSPHPPTASPANPATPRPNRSPASQTINHSLKAEPMPTQLEYGEVTALDHQTCRLRVRLDDRDGLQTYWLNIPQRNTQGTQRRPLMPEIGEQVAVLLDADGVGGVCLGGIYSTAEPPPVVDEDTEFVRYSDGTVVAYDRAAGVMRMDCMGGVVLKCAWNITIEAGQSVLIKAPSLSLDVLQATLKGDLQVIGNITATGAVMDAEGNSNHHSH